MQLLIFLSFLSPGRVKKLQIDSKVHKILSQKLAIALISNIQSLHITEENLSSWEMFKIITSEALDKMHVQLFLIAERGQSTTVVVLISGAFVRSRLITNLSTPE